MLADFFSGKADGSSDQPEDRASDIEKARVDQAKAGDPAIWDAWFNSYYEKIYQYAYFRLRRRTEAEDIASQVFLEAVKGIDRYQHRGRPVVAWLYGIAHNLVVDRQKDDRRREHIAATATASDGSDAGLEQLIESLDLRNALDQLTEEQQEVIIHRFLLATPAKVVAATLGKSEAAVFSLQARALFQLRQHLDKRGQP